MIRGCMFAVVVAAVSLSLPGSALENFDEKMKGLEAIKSKWASKHPLDEAMDAASPNALPTFLHPEAAEGDMTDMLSSLHQNIQDVHSSVHDTLDDSLSHPGLAPLVRSLHSGLGDHGEDAEGAGALPVESAKDGAANAPAEEEEAKAVHGMQKLMGAVKMIVMLKPMLEPLKEKLTLALKHLKPADAEKAKGILNHIEALSIYSKVTAGLMAGVIEAKSGTEEDKQKAMATLIVGVKQIQDTVAEHLTEMKAETLGMSEHPEDPSAEDSAAPAEEEEGMPFDKMTALLVKLGKKIEAEIKDPGAKHNPKVLLDIKLFLAVKETLQKSEALVMAGKIALKKATTPEEKEAVKAAIKKGMGQVATTLKSKMAALKKDAMLLAVAAAKDQEGGASSAEGDQEGGASSAEGAKGRGKEHGAPDDEADSEKEEGSTKDDDDTEAESDESEDSDDSARVRQKSTKKKHEDEEESRPKDSPHKAQGSTKNPDDHTSAKDILKIFDDAADEATQGSADRKAMPLLDADAFHLRTH